VAKIIDPKPWLRARRDAQLQRLEDQLASAGGDEDIATIHEAMKVVRREYRKQLRRSRMLPW